MSRINPRLQQYNNPESYTMGKEAAKFLIGQLFARQITSAEFEKQFGTVEKYLCWYEIQNDLPNSFITDGEEMCELLKMISPSGAEDYKQECLKRMAEAKKLESERQDALTNSMADVSLNVDSEYGVRGAALAQFPESNASPPTPVVVPPTPTLVPPTLVPPTPPPTATSFVSPTPPPTPTTDKPKRKTGGRKKKDA